MVNLIMEWLAIAGVSENAIQDLFVQQLSDIICSVFDPGKADAVFEQAKEVRTC